MVAVGWPTEIAVPRVPDEEKSLLSPLYNAVMVSEPAGRVLVVKLAIPFVRVALPRDVDPTVNVTLPVAMLGVTVTVIVTAVP
jgi:hypothetical protein